MKDLYQQITDAILGSVDSAGSWRMPWTGRSFIPINAISGRRYHGINVLLLWMAGQEKGYSQSRWATLRGWNAGGCRVKKGERGTEIVLAKPVVKNEGTPDERRFTFLKSFYVFNGDQCTGEIAAAPRPLELRDGQRFDTAEQLIIATKIKINDNADYPHYRPSTDTVGMPLFERFVSPKSYYATLFHELGHATGHKSRLDRNLASRFQREAYAMEELVAEIASSFVCGHLGIESSMREDHAPYIKNWLEVLKNDNGAIIAAASAAGKAADWIIGQAEPAHIEAEAPVGEAA